MVTKFANPIILCALEKKKKQLIKRYPDGNGLNYLVKGSFASLSSRKDLEDVKAFFETKGEFFFFLLNYPLWVDD